MGKGSFFRFGCCFQSLPFTLLLPPLSHVIRAPGSGNHGPANALDPLFFGCLSAIM